MPLFTSDWEDEMFTKLETESRSNEDMTTSAQRGSVVPGYIIPYKMALVAIGVLGIVTNGLVLGCFCISGRPKMNSSSFHVANHTTLGQLLTCPGLLDAISLHAIAEDDTADFATSNDFLDLLNIVVFLCDLANSYDP